MKARLKMEMAAAEILYSRTKETTSVGMVCFIMLFAIQWHQIF